MRVSRVGGVVAGIAVLVAACGGTVAPSGGTVAPSGEPSTAVTAGVPVTLTIESWRGEDLPGWRDQIIPAFEATHPNIKVTFGGVVPAEFDAGLKTRLASGTAGDLISCRPFDGALALYNDGYLTSLNGLPGLENFNDTAKSAWQTDDHAQTYCVPMASVIQGFIYNADAFAQLGLTVPTTQDEFVHVLQAIKKDGRYETLAVGTKDEWPVGEMGYMTIGANYWHGEDGRLALVNGTAKMTDQPYVDAFKALASWTEFLPAGNDATSYSDSQTLFTLGRAAIMPAGSWEIPGFEKQVDFKLGFFAPPVPTAGATQYILKHTDIAIGMNAKTSHPDETKQFLEWLTTAEFATVSSNALPGFFTLSNHDIVLEDPLAQEFAQAAKGNPTTIRMSYQLLSRGTPNFTTELYRVSALVVRGKLSPEAAAKELQDGLDTWYKP